MGSKNAQKGGPDVMFRENDRWENAVFKELLIQAIFQPSRTRTMSCSECKMNVVCGQAYSTVDCRPVNEYYCQTCWNLYANQMPAKDKHRWYNWARRELESVRQAPPT